MARNVSRYVTSNVTRQWSSPLFRYLYVKTLPLISGAAPRIGMLAIRDIFLCDHFIHYEIHGASVMLTDLSLEGAVFNNSFAAAFDGEIIDIALSTRRIPLNSAQMEVVISILVATGNLVELHFLIDEASSLQNRSIFHNFFLAVGDFLESGNTLKSLLLHPKELEIIKSHSVSFLPLRLSKVSQFDQLKLVKIGSKSAGEVSWITGWLSDGSLALFEREAYYYSERLIQPHSRLSDLLLTNVFGVKPHLSDSAAKSQVIVVSHLLKERWLCSLNREGWLRVYDLSSTQKRLVQQLQILQSQLMASNSPPRELAEAFISSCDMSSGSCAVVVVYRDSDIWKINELKCTFASETGSDSFSISEVSVMPFPFRDAFLSCDPSVVDILSATPTDLHLEEGSRESGLILTSLWNFVALCRFDHEEKPLEKRWNGVFLQSTLSSARNIVEGKEDLMVSRPVFLPSFSSRHETIEAIEDLIIASCNVSTGILEIQERAVEHLIRHSVYSFETIMQALDTFYARLVVGPSQPPEDSTFGSKVQHSSLNHPMIKLLQYMEPQALFPSPSLSVLSPGMGLKSSISMKTIELILQLVDQRSKQLMAASASANEFHTFGVASASQLSSKFGKRQRKSVRNVGEKTLFDHHRDSIDFLRLYFYGKSVIEFIRCCDHIDTKQAESSRLVGVLRGKESQGCGFLIGSGLSSVHSVFVERSAAQQSPSHPLLTRFFSRSSDIANEVWLSSASVSVTELMRRPLSRSSLDVADREVRESISLFLKEQADFFIRSRDSLKSSLRKERSAEISIDDFDLVSDHMLSEVKREVLQWLASFNYPDERLAFSGLKSGEGNSLWIANCMAQRLDSYWRESIRRGIQYAVMIHYLLDYQAPSLSIATWTELQTSILRQLVLVINCCGSQLLASRLFPQKGSTAASSEDQSDNEEETPEFMKKMYAVSNYEFRVLPSLVSERSLSENFYFLCLQSSEGAGPQSAVSLAREWLFFAAHYKQYNLLRLLASAALIHLELSEDHDDESDEQSVLISSFDRLWLRLLRCFSEYQMLKQVCRRIEKSSSEAMKIWKQRLDNRFSDMISLLKQLEAAALTLLRSGAEGASLFSVERKCPSWALDSLKSSLLPLSTSLAIATDNLSSREDSRQEMMVVFWSLIQQLHLCELYQLHFPPRQHSELLYSQTIAMIHEVYGARIRDETSEIDGSDWNNFLLKVMTLLSQSCDHLLRIPRVVTQALYDMLRSSTSAAVSLSLLETSAVERKREEILQFQKMFCSDFFRKLTNQGQFFALYQLDSLLGILSPGSSSEPLDREPREALQLRVIEDLSHALFTSTSVEKEVILEVIFAIHFLKNDFQKAIQLFLQPPIPELSSPRRTAVALNLFSLLPDHERFELSRVVLSSGGIPTGDDLRTKLVANSDFPGLLSRFLHNYCCELLAIPPSVSASQLLTELLQESYWQEALLFLHITERLHPEYKSEDQAEDESSVCGYRSVEELLLFFMLYFQNGEVDKSLEPLPVLRFTPHLSCYPAVPGSSTRIDQQRTSQQSRDFFQRKLGREWILHLIATSSLRDPEVSRQLFLSLLSFLSSPASCPGGGDGELHATDFSLLLQLLMRSWHGSDRDMGKSASVLAVVDPIPVLLQHHRIAEAVQLTKERLRHYCEAMEDKLANLTATTPRDATSFRQFRNRKTGEEEVLLSLFQDHGYLLTGFSLHRLRSALLGASSQSSAIGEIDDLLQRIQDTSRLFQSLGGDNHY